MASGSAWREPAYWPGGARHGGDASPVCGFHVERGKACPDTAVRGGRREGVFQAAGNRKGLSTVAGCAGGPVRSSDDASVMEAERRGRVVRGCVRSINRAGVRKESCGRVEVVRQTV